MDQQYFGVSLEKLLNHNRNHSGIDPCALPQGRTCRESDSLQYRKYLH